MKKVVIIDELDFKEVVSALRNLRCTVSSLEARQWSRRQKGATENEADEFYMVGELDAQLERIEKVFEEGIWAS